MNYSQQGRYNSVWDDIKSGDIINNVDKRVLLGLSIVGGITLISQFSKKMSSFFKYFVRPCKDLKKRYGDSWVLVTGASDGIGKGYAVEFARRGFNIVLVARDHTKTNMVAREIELAHQVKTKVMLFDFNKEYNKAQYEQTFVKEIANLDIGILVNNVGTGELSPYVIQEDSSIIRHIKVNVVSQSMVTRFMLPKLLGRQKRSAILNISTSLVDKPAPFMAMICATNAYNWALSESLALEYPEKIDSVAVMCGSVRTQINKYSTPFQIDPAQHAKAVVDKLGYERQLYGHHVHGIAAWLISNPLINYKAHEPVANFQRAMHKEELERIINKQVD